MKVKIWKDQSSGNWVMAIPASHKSMTATAISRRTCCPDGESPGQHHACWCPKYVSRSCPKCRRGNRRNDNPEGLCQECLKEKPK